jgi:peptidoglycan/LPS O-acetylase OafA/YrhL
MGWSWFLANDMQFYIFTPIFAILWRKNRIAAWVLLIVLSIGSIEANWILTDHYDLSPMNPNNDTFNSVLYNKPYARCVAYLQGVAVAFLLQYDNDWTRNRIVRYLGYAVSFALTFCPVYLTSSFWRNGGHWSTINNEMYISFSRVGFLLGIMFVMYSMYKKHTFLLRKVLSGYIWVFLARLTYTAYLLHPMIIFVQYFSATRVFHFNYIYAASQYITNIVIAYTLGLVFHLAMEKPTANLERLFLPHKK